MPITAPKIKINNTKKYGADIILYDPYKEQRESIAEVLADKENIEGYAREKLNKKFFQIYMHIGFLMI